MNEQEDQTSANFILPSNLMPLLEKLVTKGCKEALKIEINNLEVYRFIMPQEFLKAYGNLNFDELSRTCAFNNELNHIEHSRISNLTDLVSVSKKIEEIACNPYAITNPSINSRINDLRTKVETVFSKQVINNMLRNLYFLADNNRFEDYYNTKIEFKTAIRTFEEDYGYDLSDFFSRSKLIEEGFRKDASYEYFFTEVVKDLESSLDYLYELSFEKTENMKAENLISREKKVKTVLGDINKHNVRTINNYSIHYIEFLERKINGFNAAIKYYLKKACLDAKNMNEDLMNHSLRCAKYLMDDNCFVDEKRILKIKNVFNRNYAKRTLEILEQSVSADELNINYLSKVVSKFNNSVRELKNQHQTKADIEATSLYEQRFNEVMRAYGIAYPKFFNDIFFR